MSSTFRMNFDIKNYEHLFPEMPKDYSLIINSNIQEPEKQYWQRIKEPRNKDGSIRMDEKFMLIEADRQINGAWIFIKGELMWLPPDFYTFLQYGNAMGKPPMFWLKRLKYAYHEVEMVADPRWMGDLVFKNRKDGETLYKAWCALMAPLRQNVTHCTIGMQSKDLKTVKDTCWMFIKSHLNGLSKQYKDFHFPDLVSDEKIQETIRIERKRNELDPDDFGRYILYNFGTCTPNHYDGTTDLLMWLGDEWAKWEQSIIETVICLQNIIFPGNQRMGQLRLFSSPSEKNGFSNDNAIKMWSSANEINPETGISANMLKPYYSNPADGIQGFYDIYGDVDPEQCIDWVLKNRKSKKGEELLQAIRAYPLPIKGTDKPNPEELFGATNTGPSVFFNISGIKKQDIYLTENPPQLSFGNLEWPDNIPVSGMPIFTPYDTDKFDEFHARWAFVTTDFKREVGADPLKPPSLIENCVGFDPINRLLRSADKKVRNRLSTPQAVCWRFSDISNTGLIKMPIAHYIGQSGSEALSHMDLLKFAIFTGSPIQYEKSDGLSFMKFMYERGMEQWMLDGYSNEFVLIEDKIAQKMREVKVKGDMGSGRGASEFLNELIRLINGATGGQFNEGETDETIMLKWKLHTLVKDLINFDPYDTEKAHGTMALGHALLGSSKLLYGKRKQEDSPFNNMVLKMISRL